MVSDQPDEINKGDWYNKAKKRWLSILLYASVLNVYVHPDQWDLLKWHFMVTQGNVRAQNSFHSFRAVAMGVSCTDLTGAKENTEYHRTDEIHSIRKFLPSLKYFIRTHFIRAIGQVHRVNEWGVWVGSASGADFHSLLLAHVCHNNLDFLLHSCLKQGM